MSGGGARDYPPPRDVNRLRTEALSVVQDQALEAEVNRLLRSELAEINDRDVEATRARLEAAFVLLNDVIEGDPLTLMFGGSVAKHTYVDGFSDVDALVVISSTDARSGPAQVIADFAAVLRRRIGEDVSSVTPGRLAVTLTYSDRSELQLLPAVRRGDTVAIASADGTSWATIRPQRFAQKLAAENERNRYQLVPTLKLAKRLIASLPEDRRLSGYHTESLGIEAFEGYAGPHTLKTMLTRYFEQASTMVLRPIRDSTGQSVHVDDYLGDADSLERQVAANALERLARRLKYAVTIDQWRGLFRS
jgi:hypothetical protein